MADFNKDEKIIKKNKESINAYMKYSGMGIQMALIISVLSYAGLLLDNYLKSNPVFTVIFALGSVILAMYVFIRQVITEKNGKNSNDRQDEN
jgi:F0F1-type ATP synthase assembly protein I